MTGTAVITGANRGIGLSLAKLYGQRGWRVIGLCRTPSPGLEACATRVITDVDVGKPDACDRVHAALQGETIDLLINNAGILRNEILGQLDFGAMSQQFQVNALGPLRITEALLGNMSSGSKIAMITSRMGSIEDNGSGGRYGYRMSKAALNAASKSLAIDLRPKGIAVGVYHPGLVGTDMIGGAGDITPDEAALRIADRIDELIPDNSGSFWHSNGEKLPW